MTDDWRRDPRPQLERLRALPDERLEPVDDLAAGRARRGDERRIGPVRPVGELDHHLTRLWLDEQLVPYRRRVHDQVAAGRVGRPLAAHA